MYGASFPSRRPVEGREGKGGRENIFLVVISS